MSLLIMVKWNRGHIGFEMHEMMHLDSKDFGAGEYWL
jgi:hypothetical protein